MMNRFIWAIAFLLLFACAGNDQEEGQAPVLIRNPCGEADISWLYQLIQKAETDPVAGGSIYGVIVNGQVIVVYQRYVSSCLGCTLFDCQGNTIATNSIDLPSMIAAMTDEAIIYRSAR